jgi:predicted DNA-binding transcriptional regulator YafY
MRNAEVIRQWKILKRIEAGRYTTAQDMAEEHGVTERTIRRDIEALQEAGFPLYDERAEGRKIWRLIEGYKQRLGQTFSLSELSALYFSKNLMSFLGGAPFAQDLESAFAKIQEALPARSLPYLARIQELFSARPDPWKDYSRKKDVIAALVDATLHQKRARIEYFSFNSKRTKPYTVDPYRLVYYRGGLYLYARAEEYDEVRTFAVERIEKIDVSEQGFELPADFDASAYARGAFGIAGGKAEPVEIVFSADMAGYIQERVWHESQQIEPGPNGTVVLRMNVAPGFELKSWIKGFLPHVKVVKPASLKADIAADLEAAASDFAPTGRKAR